MNVQSLINEGVELFKNKKFDEAIERLNQALDGIEDKKSKILIKAQHWLGRCYLEQAMKAKGKDSEQLFEEAVKHLQQRLSLANQLKDKEEQIYAQAWLGLCYLEYAKKAKGKESEQLFGEAVKHLQQRLSLANQLKDKDNSLQRQINAQHWLGLCYLEYAKKAKGKESEQLFREAVKHLQQRLSLANQLKDKEEQIYAQSWLGRCYLEQAIRSEVELADRLFETAVDCYKEQLSLSEDIEDEQNSLQARNSAQSRLGRCYFEQAMKAGENNLDSLFKQSGQYFQQRFRIKQLPSSDNPQNEENGSLYWRKNSSHHEKWQRYFDWKVEKIQEDLSKTDVKRSLTKVISTILAVLNITPRELGDIPIAHYTSSVVCEKLFSIGSDKEASSMRMGSSTYMNDPAEGEGLLELLNLQDLELDNKVDCPVYNAFFTCFSSRVNDLNQFRLYGKENGVEASGCCLVFNKRRGWLKDPDILASFRSLTDTSNESTEISAGVSDLVDVNLPLYQVAYIAYYDEYIAKEKCIIWLPNEENPKFGIRLKPVGKNPDWHEFRIGKLKKALEDLREESNNINNKDRKALEYIRYLFKDFAFRDEEEFRLLKIEQIGSDKIEYCEATKSIYLPYADVRDMVDEVILGTNYEKSGNHRKAEVFQHLMRKHYPNVKVSRSSLPINANPPIKKD